MSPSRLLPLWLFTAVALASACSSDTTPTPGDTVDGGDGDGDVPGMTRTDAGDGDGDGDTIGDGDGDIGGHDAAVDSGADAGPCIPLGCAELGFTCGLAKDNCGGDLDCEPSTGDPCTDYDTCGGDPTKPNQCGCTPKTCLDLGAACGTDLDDGCGGKVPSCGLGNCLSEGDNYICAADKSACQCVPLSESAACQDFECGAVSNGCDTQTISCGTCSANKTCEVAAGGTGSACKCDLNNATKKAAACGVKTCGTATTADGCTFSCGTACVTTCSPGGSCAPAQNCTCQNDGPGGVADQVCYQNSCCTVPATPAAACGAQACGEVTVCGVTFKCGNEGACADSTKGCSLPAQVGGYDYSITVPTCKDKNVVNMLGTYRTRAHSFRATYTNSKNLINRAESLSFVTVEIDKNSKLRLRDYGCYTTGIDIEGGNPSIAPSYYNLPELNVELKVPDNETQGAGPGTWLRSAQTTAAGFINSRPASISRPPSTATHPYFCAADSNTFTLAQDGGEGTTAQDYATVPLFKGPLVTPESGARKRWLGGAGSPADERDNQVCSCPANSAAYAALPTDSKDCRVDDPDDDDKPGFSIIAKSGNTLLNVAAASLSTTEWWGTIDPSGRHYGFGAISSDRDPKHPLSRSFLSCSGTPPLTAALLCAAAPAQEDWGCGSKFDVLLFERLPKGTRYDTFDQLKAACASYYTQMPATAVGQAVGKSGEFSYTTNCSVNGDCRADELCKAGKCWPKTSPGSCDSPQASCGDGWQCVGGTCWPATCAKPAQ